MEKKRKREGKEKKRRGKEEEMKHLCFGREWLLYVVTVCLAAGFTIAGFYALAAAGDIRKLPLRRLVMIVIVGLYSIRVIVGIGWLLYAFTYLQFFSTPLSIKEPLSLVVVCVYLSAILLDLSAGVSRLLLSSRIETRC